MIKEVITADGSLTLFSETFSEHYHSVHGAVTESMHVFIKHGFEAVDKPLVKIFEVGFGTGINAALTHAAGNDKKIHYTSIEKFPLSEDVYHKLKYTNIDYAFLVDLHKSPWNCAIQLQENFIFNKIHGSLNDYFPEPDQFDIIYFDAFSPDKQPELWTEEIFQRMFNALQVGGRLVTYCAKGIIKRRLKSCGFEVRCEQGPPGKREMIVAIKP